VCLFISHRIASAAVNSARAEAVYAHGGVGLSTSQLASERCDDLRLSLWVCEIGGCDDRQGGRRSRSLASRVGGLCFFKERGKRGDGVVWRLLHCVVVTYEAEQKQG